MELERAGTMALEKERILLALACQLNTGVPNGEVFTVVERVEIIFSVASSFPLSYFWFLLLD
jgi:hypothetical protein